jgi:cytochrome c oxidase subunit III
MASTLAPPKPKVPASAPPGGNGSGRGGFDGGDGSYGGPPDEASLTLLRYKTGTWLLLAGVVMFFAAFTSAFLVRRGISFDWRPFHLPAILWLNTVILIASSFTIDRARREVKRPRSSGLSPAEGSGSPAVAGDACLSWLAATSVLGLIFLAGQYIAWRELRTAGVYVASNPASSFFYLLTGAHGLHILGGIVALTYVVLSAWRRPSWPRKRAAVEATALYWHFMDGLWVYLFLLLQIGR